jgi:hypothetical protein
LNQKSPSRGIPYLRFRPTESCSRSAAFGIARTFASAAGAFDIDHLDVQRCRDAPDDIFLTIGKST